MHAQPGFIGYKTCRSWRVIFLLTPPSSDTTATKYIDKLNMRDPGLNTQHTGRPTTFYKLSLSLNLLDLSDDILVLIHQTDYSYRPKIELEFFIVSQKLLRGKQRRVERNVLIWFALSGSSTGIINCSFSTVHSHSR